MKPRLSQQRNRALTLLEVLVIIAVLAVLWVLLAALSVPSYKNAERINCLSNLKQIGIVYRLWAGERDNRYPMAVAVTNGGAMELVATGNVAACYQVMSNEMTTPKLLICPSDLHRRWATNFSTLKNSNISYFVGLEADESKPHMLLSGDDNLAFNGKAVKSGVLQLPTNAPVSWTKARHKFVGNIGFADGSARQVTIDELRQAFEQTGAATNRLAIP